MVNHKPTTAADPETDKIIKTVMADIKARGPIFRAIINQLKSELARIGKQF